MLIRCPECGKQISDKAESCPGCGLPKQYFFFAENNAALPESAVDKEPAGERYISKSEAGKFFNTHAPQAEALRQEHNERFVQSVTEREKEYFDNILKAVDPDVKLDDEQRRAVVTDEDHCLLVAGAGAGKTTTMAAKVKYLVEKQGVSPSDIIVISYTNKTIDELKERIHKKLRLGEVNICTFHSFGYDILRKTAETPPSVNNWGYKIIYEYLEKYVYNDNNLLRKLVLFFGYYFDMPKEVFDFKNLNEYCDYRAEKEFETLKSRLGDYNETVISGRGQRLRTITGEYVRSHQEVQIANFLYIHGIEYIYEKPYPYPIQDSNKIYTPDFYIKQGNNECWLEHFGVTEQYQNDSFKPEQLERYKAAIDKKRKDHQKNNTRLLETYSRYSDGRVLIEHLEDELIRNGFVCNRRSDETIYRKLTETAKDKYIYKFVDFIFNFLEKYKTKGYDETYFDIMRNEQHNVRTILFLEIAKEVYKYYEKALRQNNQIDFADMINDAERMLRETSETNRSHSHYKYIIIDEFQDIAKQRFNLTKTLVDIMDAKVVAVGDDWQSIYAFAGSDITLGA